MVLQLLFLGGGLFDTPFVLIFFPQVLLLLSQVPENKGFIFVQLKMIQVTRKNKNVHKIDNMYLNIYQIIFCE